MLNLHPGNMLANLSDFQSRTDEIVEKKVSDATRCFAAVREAVDNGEKVAV